MAAQDAAVATIAAAQAALSAHTRIQRMLDVEAALAQAEADAGVIPAAAVAPIIAACKAGLYDHDALDAAARRAGNLAIPLVKALTARVAAADADAARFVHWGATSQDVIDTGLVLQLGEATTPLRTEVDALCRGLAALVRTHRATPMVARTWMQHALPTTFGLKAAGWLDGLLRLRERVATAASAVNVLQFGGAAGTLASLGADAGAVTARLGERLGLAVPDLPWHVQRDRLVDLACALGMLVGQLGKIATDLALLTQTEVAEAFEPVMPGRGGSSTMPHKRNPVACAAVRAAAVRSPGLVATMLAAMSQEHERALGGWQAEWDTLPELVRLAVGASAELREAVAGLDVQPARMQANLAATGGLIMAESVMLALGRRIGRLPAHHAVETACRVAATRGITLREAMLADPAIMAELPAAELDALLDPAAYLGEADHFVERVLTRHRQSFPE